MSHGKRSVLAVAQQKVEVAGLGFSLAQSEGRESLLAMPSQIKVTTEGSYPLACICLRYSLGVSPVCFLKNLINCEASLNRSFSAMLSSISLDDASIACAKRVVRSLIPAIVAADGREHDYERRFAWQGGNVSEESIREDGTEVQRTAFRYGDTPNPLRLPLGMELSTCWSLTHTGVMGDYYHMLPLHFSAVCPVAAVCDEGASYTAEYTCDGDGRPVSGTLRHGNIRTEIAVAYF